MKESHAEEKFVQSVVNLKRSEEIDREMKIYAEIEDDADGGYEYYEDEEIELTREIVHSNGEMPPCIEYREGYFDDGTSYVSEFWCQEQATFVTYYFSTENLADDEQEIENYLIKVGKLRKGEEHYLKIMTIELSGEACYRRVGEDIYSVTVAVGDDTEEYCEAYL